MSNPLPRTYSLRKHVRPLIDIDEDEDEQRRDACGRKRVDVLECLLDTSSSDEIDDGRIYLGKQSDILWLTFDEISHIRSVLTQTHLSSNKHCLRIYRGLRCFQCKKKINYFFLLPLFLHFIKYETCFVCRQIICKKCSYSHFKPPSMKLLIPVRIQSLIKPTWIAIENTKEQINKTNEPTKTICYDCLQVFNIYIQTPKYRLKPPLDTFRRTLSLPSKSSVDSNGPSHTRHRRRSSQTMNYQIGKAIIASTSFDRLSAL